jgi:hypothetical protein
VLISLNLYYTWINATQIPVEQIWCIHIHLNVRSMLTPLHFCWVIAQPVMKQSHYLHTLSMGLPKCMLELSNVASSRSLVWNCISTLWAVPTPLDHHLGLPKWSLGSPNASRSSFGTAQEHLGSPMVGVWGCWDCPIINWAIPAPSIGQSQHL